MAIHPKYFKLALHWKYMDGKGLQRVEEPVTLEMMKACAKWLKEHSEGEDIAAWVVTQGHGDIVRIPVGYAHVVTNGGPCFKMAMDYIPNGHFYQCMISHLLIGRKLDMKLTNDYLNITSHVFQNVHDRFPKDSLPIGFKDKKQQNPR